MVTQNSSLSTTVNDTDTPGLTSTPSTSCVVTLEPFNPSSPSLPPLGSTRASASSILEDNSAASGWQTVNRRRQNIRKRDERRIRQLEAYNMLFQNPEPYFDRFFTIRFPVQNISADLNVIRAELDIKTAIGKPKKIIKANRNSLLIEAATKAQSEKISRLHSIADLPVTVSPFSRLNTERGIVRSKAMGQCTREELLECLSGQGVVDLQRLKTRRDGELVDLDTYVVTFQATSLPKVIKLSDWHTELVDEYVERPRQCFKCQKFGHVAKYCRQQLETCGHCGTLGHKRDTCTNNVSCFHCKGAHRSSDKSCRKYIIESDVLKTQHKEKTSRIIALDVVLSRYPQYLHLYDRPEVAASSSAVVQHAPTSLAVSSAPSSASPAPSDVSVAFSRAVVVESLTPSHIPTSSTKHKSSPTTPVTVAPTAVVSSGIRAPLSSIKEGSRRSSVSPRRSSGRERSPPGDLRTVVAPVSVHREQSRSDRVSRNRDTQPRAGSASSSAKDAAAPKQKYNFTRLAYSSKAQSPTHSKRKISSSHDSLTTSPTASHHKPKAVKKSNTPTTKQSNHPQHIPVLGS